MSLLPPNLEKLVLIQCPHVLNVLEALLLRPIGSPTPCPSLRRLELYCNQLTDEDIPRLCTLIHSQCPNLRELDLLKNGIETLQEFAQTELPKRLKYLLLSGNPVLRSIHKGRENAQLMERELAFLVTILTKNPAFWYMSGIESDCQQYWLRRQQQQQQQQQQRATTLLALPKFVTRTFGGR